jgi:hypothetical protein
VHIDNIAIRDNRKENTTINLEANLTIPDHVNTKGIDLFAHESDV